MGWFSVGRRRSDWDCTNLEIVSDSKKNKNIRVKGYARQRYDRLMDERRLSKLLEDGFV